MSSLMLIGLFGTFLAVLASVIAVGGYASDRRRTLHLLEASVGTATTTNLREQALTPSLTTRLIGPLMGRVGPLSLRFAPVHMRKRIAWKIVQAGSPAGWDAEKVLVARFVGVILLPLLTLFLVGGSGTTRLLLVGAAAYAGYFGPVILLDGRIAKRRANIQRSLADTIDLLTISVEAGLGFDAALAQVVKNVPGDLSEEIARTLREMQLGVSRAEAFRNFKQRTEVEELKAFTLAIIQADTFGISIANVLRAQSDTVRTKRRQQIEERAMKVTVKILFPLIFCVLPSLFIVVLGPGIIRLMDSFFGI